jgi:hypothetical protein
MTVLTVYICVVMVTGSSLHQVDMEGLTVLYWGCLKEGREGGDRARGEG